MIAALYVETNGAYFGLEGVDPWDEKRDARMYAGPHPVVAHPPCSRWCQLARLNEKRYGHKVGDDGGCFESALNAVRTWGGVLEHPAYSIAWRAFGLPRPSASSMWTEPDEHGGRTIHVEQGHYGHRARKGTWLYAVRTELPDLARGKSEAKAWTSWGDKDRYPDVPRLGKREAKATPPEFREVLLSMARSVHGA